MTMTYTKHHIEATQRMFKKPEMFLENQNRITQQYKIMSKVG